MNRVLRYLTILLLVSTGSMAHAQAMDPDLRMFLMQVDRYVKAGDVSNAFVLVQKLKRTYPSDPYVMQAEAAVQAQIVNLPSQQQPEQDEAELRLSLSRVTIHTEKGEMDQAFAEIDTLKRHYPNHPYVLQAEADLYTRVGNRGKEQELLHRAVTLDPYNEDILKRRHYAQRQRAPRSSFDVGLRSTGQATEHITRLNNQVEIEPLLAASLLVENNHAKTRGLITRSNGDIERFSGDRQRATLALTQTYDDGDEAQGALYYGKGVIGAGASYSWWDRDGVTRLEANLRRPEWDFIQAVIDEGAQDNVQLSRLQRIGNHTQLNGGLGFNHYSLDGDSAASAIALNAGLGYSAPFSSQPGDPAFGIFYTLDAEYFLDVNSETGPGGIFEPLPASTYEVHALNLSATQEIYADFYIEGYGGYAVDRLGGDGPLYGGSLQYTPEDSIGAELSASRGIMGERSDEEADYIGLGINWRW